MRVEAQQGESESQRSGVGISLLEAPESRRDDPRARIYIVDHVSQGTTIERRLQVSNRSDRPAQIRLYIAGATAGAGAFRASDEADQDLVEWGSLDQTELSLGPGERSQFQVRIDVPAGVPDGERYGVIFAELPPAEGAPGQVGIGARVGLRIYLSVGEGREPASDFEIRSLTARRDRDGRKQVTAQVRNTGGRALDMSGELELKDGPGGLSAGPFDARLGTTLGIGLTGDVTVDLDEAIPDGPWLARLTLQSGELERTAEATITFPREAGASAEPVEAREVTGTLPGIIALGASIFLLLLLGGWLFWFLFKRRARRKDDEEEERR